MNIKKIIVYSLCLVLFTFVLNLTATAQGKFKKEILADEDLAKVVPTGFYFAGQSAPTQARNSAAVRFGKERYVIAGLVDTSGYSTEISGKYEGFFITDSPIKIGNQFLNTGAYGFGFAKNGKVNIFDLSGKQILSVNTSKDANFKRPRPLMMTDNKNGVRLYKEKSYVIITPN